MDRRDGARDRSDRALARAALGEGAVGRAAVGIAARARGEGAWASEVLAAELRRLRLGSAERRFVADAVYGQLRLHRKIDHLLSAGLRPTGRGLGDVPAGEADRARFLAWLVLAAGVPAEDAAAAASPRLRPGVAAVGRAAQIVGRIADPLRRAAVDLSLPDWLLGRLVAELGEGPALALGAALGERAPLAVRANALRGPREALIERLQAEGVVARPSAIAPDGVVLETRVNAFGLATFREGWFEVQDEGSQVIAEVTAPPPGGRVLDACAGAGGKTLALAARMGGRGQVRALDVSAPRIEELRRRARRAGLSNVRAERVAAGAGPPPDLLGRADRVLCDVPCSGIGALRRNPEARWRLRPADADELPHRQLAILEAYAPAVRPGGRLVYATCTVLAAENDGVIAGFLERHPEFTLVSLAEVLGRARAEAVGDGTVLRLWPHVHGTDGFFAAVMRRTGGAAGSAVGPTSPTGT